LVQLLPTFANDGGQFGAVDDVVATAQLSAQCFRIGPVLGGGGQGVQLKLLVEQRYFRLLLLQASVRLQGDEETLAQVIRLGRIP